MDMWVVAGSVERARASNGTVPRTLDGVLEEPEDAEDIRYVVLGAREYMLVGERMGTSVRWTSSEGMAALSAVPAESVLQESTR